MMLIFIILDYIIIPDLIEDTFLLLCGFKIFIVHITQLIGDITATGMALESQTAHTRRTLHYLVELVSFLN